MQIWIHDNKMRKITALNNDVPDMLSYTNSTWHSYLDQATSTFDFTIPKFSNGELHEDLKLINDECFVSFYVNGSYQVFYIATLQEDDFNIQLTCNNTNLEYALEYANPFSADSAQTIEWYLNQMELLAFAAVEIGNNEIPDRKRTLTFDSQETKMNRLQSLMSKFEAEFEFKVELNRDGTYKRIVINIYQEADDTHHGIGTDRKDVVLYYSNGLKGVQVSSDKTQMFNAGVFTGKDGLNLADVEISEKNADGIEEFYSRKGDLLLHAPLSMQHYPATMKPDGQDNWIRKDFQTEYENVNDLKAYALRTLKKYAYPLVTYTASVQSGFVSHYTDLKLGDTIRIIDKNFVGGLALEARVSEMIISFDNPANNSFVFTNYKKIDNKPSSALQTRIEQAVESKLPYRIELATTGGVTFKNNEGETIVKPSLYKGNLPYTKDVSWHWTLGGVSTVGTQYSIQARDITGTEVLKVAAYVGNLEVATTEITLTNVDDGVGVESIDRHFTSSDQSDGVTIEGAEWSDKPPAPTEDGKYLWAYDEITYTDGTVTTTKPAAVGANFDVDAFRAEIAEDLKDVPNREEFENKIAEELATSKAEITTQIETAKTQAESNAKEYADTINQETAKVAELANAAADEIKADLVNVKNNLTATSLVANNAQAAVDEAKQDLVNVASELNTAKQDLMSHAQQLQTQANAQSELTNRVSTVEETANGTKTTVSELSKTVDSNTKNITSVTARTKVVEDDLTSTKTTLSQVKTTADSASQKTATLETGLNGLTAKFNSLSVGGANLFKGSRDFSGSWMNGGSGVYAEDYQGVKIFKKNSSWSGLSQYFEVKTGEEYVFSAYVKSSAKTDGVNFYLNHESKQPVAGGTVSFDTNSGRDQINLGLTDKYQRISIKIKIISTGWIMPRIERYNTDAYLFFGGYKLERGNVATDYNPNDADIEQKVAEYKQNADQNYASLQSNLQTLDGTVKQNKSEFEQTASQIKSSISAVEGKIPTSIGGRNLLSKTNQGKINWSWIISSGGTTAEDYNADGVKAVKLTRTSDASFTWDYIAHEGLIRNLIEPNTKYTLSFDVKPSVDVTFTAALKRGDDRAPLTNVASMNKALANKWTKVSCVLTSKATLPDDPGQVVYLSDMPVAKGNYLIIKNIKLEKGAVPSDWSPAPEDTANQISSLSSQIQQTADGMTLLATKTELNTAKNELQSGITTATNKANNNAQTISTHTTQISALNSGLQAKVSQTDFNTLSGRVTTAENNITAKANELSSKITSVEGKIPTSIGGRNLWIQSKAYGGFGGFTEETLPDNHITGQKVCYRINSGAEMRFNIEPDFSPRLYRTITFSAWIKYENVVQGSNNWNVFNCFKHNFTYHNSKTGASSDVDYLTLASYTGTADWKYVHFTVDYSARTGYDQLKGSLLFNLEGTKSGTAWVTGIKVEIGSIPSDYSPAPEDTISQISSLSSELKQTTDAIKASVSSLDNSTVKSSSLTINADGIVMKAGKSTTDVANAIGSYFAVNQNAINLFSDKINVKGNMIVNGAITSDKIASKQINTAHLNGKIITADVIATNAITADAIKAGAVTTDKMSANSINGDRITAGTLDAAKIKAGSISASQIASGTITSAQIKAGAIKSINIEASAITSDKIAANSITGDKIKANSVDVSKIVGIDANFIKSRIEYAMIDWLKGKTIVADNGATKIDLLSGYINFDSDTPAVRRVTPGIPTQFIKFLKSDNNSVTTIGSNRDGSESSMNDSFAGIKITSGDLIEQTEIISDQIYFFTGAANRQGWQMSTVSGGDHRQVTLFPSGNPTKSNIYASDYFIRGSNGWVNLLDFIDYFNACLKHLQNHTGRYDIWQPFKI